MSKCTLAAHHAAKAHNEIKYIERVFCFLISFFELKMHKKKKIQKKLKMKMKLEMEMK